MGLVEAGRERESLRVKAEEVMERFRRTGALLEGHFVLTSGLHSTNYLQSALVLQQPPEAGALARAIAAHYSEQQVETVAAPAIGGIIIGWEVARALRVRSIWTEREAGAMTLRRGFTIRPGERILVVEDVITTGGSPRETCDALRAPGRVVGAAAATADPARETCAALRAAGPLVVGAASIIARSGGRSDVGVPRVALATLEVP